MKTNSYVWRIEGRANPFVPWMVLRHVKKLEDACAAVPLLKRQGQFYAVRVRAN